MKLRILLPAGLPATGAWKKPPPARRANWKQPVNWPPTKKRGRKNRLRPPKTCAVVHYFWLVKNVYTQPLIFAAIVGFLLLTRVPPVKQRLTQWRKQLWGGQRKRSPASTD